MPTLSPTRRAATLRRAPSRSASGTHRSAPTGTIDRRGGAYSAGLITGVSAITRGEALGHGFWVDQEFLAQTAHSLNAAGEDGAKVRFKHPGLSSDGLGTTLGRAIGARVQGDQVLTDLHLLQSAHDTPEGDLADYVLSFAEESPDLFGTSIVFRIDQDATKAHALEHGAVEVEDPLFGPTLDYSAYTSPDELNTGNLPHVRLAGLRAVDVVDEPAANAGGMFSSLNDEGTLLDAFQATLAFTLGLTEDLPADLDDGLPIHPLRLRRFTQAFLAERGLTLQPSSNHQTPPPPTMFKKDTDKDERIAVLENQLAESERQFATATEELATAREDLAAAKQAADDHAAESQLAADQIAELQGKLADIDAKLADLADREEKLAETVDTQLNARLHAELAKLGHPAPLDIDGDDNPTADLKTEADQLSAIDDPAQAYRFARENKAAIISAEFGRK